MQQQRWVAACSIHRQHSAQLVVIRFPEPQRLKNKLFAEGGKALAAGLKGNQVITELDISKNSLGRDSDHAPADISGIIAIADVIGDGALSVLSLKSNALLTKEAGKILGDMLKDNAVLTEPKCSLHVQTHVPRIWYILHNIKTQCTQKELRQNSQKNKMS